MDHDRLYELTMRAIGCALDGNAAGASDAMVEIGQNGTWHNVYGACCAFAEVGKAALVKFYGDQAPDASQGGMWAMQMLPGKSPDPAEVFATRFIVAYANDDKDTAIALFRGALESSDEEYVSSVAQLLATAASLANGALAHIRARE
ncbi:hypothetical protein SAMN04487981_101636 [Streptomyces sp. cf386]|uniref:hypothetical protein n=1 Tax=Streptomyces sp. cf386 TaxID=1761904 RepID=UPI00089165B2|nr:hypothetical protein [Streptomyces sp. cf386]SDM47316.1 hypothetical protein SAMN04487981_101636 [Streptomyces sp. cf386]